MQILYNGLLLYKYAFNYLNVSILRYREGT